MRKSVRSFFLPTSLYLLLIENMESLQEKLGVILGGTSGIGKALVQELFALGANVVFSGTNKERGKELENQLNASLPTPRVVFCQCDITDWAAQEMLFKTATDKFNGPIYIVIVVAGILESSDLIDDSEQDGIYRTLQVNLAATAKANRLAIQHFLKNGRSGCIVNTSSVFGLCGAPLAPLYTASKHGIIGLTRSYGSLFRSTDIRVNVVAPHFVDTPMIQGAARNVAGALGMVPMSFCVEAYIRAIQETSLNGDVLTVMADGITVESRFSDTVHARLDDLCVDRKKAALEKIIEHFSNNDNDL
ncbi:hypothetical protein VTP01DRAFT_8206 [Rhizomucor pusillus]|uniref:uncharacterized protein n=1 Tax=Rhizomucor pusillus TaxID=4840 RepID=UPI00374451C4